jgi:hypothetical protein
MHYRLPDSHSRTIEIVRDARALLWLCLTQHDMLHTDYLAELHCRLSPLSGFPVHQTPLRHKIAHRDPCPFAFNKSCSVILGTAESIKMKVLFLKRSRGHETFPTIVHFGFSKEKKNDSSSCYLLVYSGFSTFIWSGVTGIYLNSATFIFHGYVCLQGWAKTV